MCGIAGIISRSSIGVNRNVLNQMLETLDHRGPDGKGISIDQGVGLAHARLSIIDLENGTQPLSNEDGTVKVTYNGEIYNYKDLIDELTGLGHRFRTRCDTEVIVHAWEQWGIDCLKRFHGMFAFALYDSKSETTFLARDRIGIKPLFYTSTPTALAFASEIQALEVLPDFNFEVDPQSLKLYFSLHYIPSPRTIYKRTHKLQPGHWIKIPKNGTPEPPVRYWDVDFKPDNVPSEDEWIERLDSEIRQSVKQRMQSDVPFGAFLSGGIDSSLVVAYMSESLNRPVDTYSIGFDDPSFCELEHARFVSKHFGTKHSEVILDSSAIDFLPNLIRHYGEPFADSSAIPTYVVSQLAGRDVTVVLSGDGGDELFGGYGRYIDALKPAWQRLSRKPSARMRRLLASTASGLKLRKNRTKKLQALIIDRYLSVMTHQNQKEVCDPTFPLDANVQNASDWIYSKYIRHDLQEHLSILSYIDLHTYLCDDILTKVDVASMSHSIEVRTPLLEHQVVELAARIPEKYKIEKNGSGKITKSILRKLATQHLPQNFVNRKKQGFSVPLSSWLLRDRHSMVVDKLTEANDLFTHLIDARSIEGLINTSQELIDENAGSAIWLLLALKEWCDQHPQAYLVPCDSNTISQ